MREASILIVEDDPSLCDMIAYGVSSVGYKANKSHNADEALLLIDKTRPDLILLDWMLPGLSGVEFARRLRRDDYTADIPIIMLTARGDEDDRLSGFEAGVDDYIVKPFSPRELVARIKAILRRVDSNNDNERLFAGVIELDSDSHRVNINHNEIKLGPTEFSLLKHFMQSPDRVHSREHLLDNVWGRSAVVEERTVDVHILRLRKALKEAGVDNYIQTIRGIGYRFSAIN